MKYSTQSEHIVYGMYQWASVISTGIFLLWGGEVSEAGCFVRWLKHHHVDCIQKTQRPGYWIPIKSPKTGCKEHIAFQNHDICIFFFRMSQLSKRFLGSVCVYMFFYSFFSPNKSDVMVGVPWWGPAWQSCFLLGVQAFNRIAKIDVTVEATVQGVFVGGRRGFDGIRNGNSPRKLSPKKRHDGSMVGMVFAWMLLIFLAN